MKPADLIARYRTGWPQRRAAARDALWVLWKPRVEKLAQRLTRELLEQKIPVAFEEVKDICEDALFATMLKPDFDPDRPESDRNRYLATSMTNAVWMARRKWTKRGTISWRSLEDPVAGDGSIVFGDTLEDPAAGTGQAEARAMLLRAFPRLTNYQQEVVTLTLAGCDGDEVARRTRRSRSQIAATQREIGRKLGRGDATVYSCQEDRVPRGRPRRPQGKAMGVWLKPEVREVLEAEAKARGVSKSRLIEKGILALARARQKRLDAERLAALEAAAARTPE